MFVTCLDPLRHTEWTSETRTQPSRIAVVGRLKRIEQRMLLLLLCSGKTGGTIYTCTCCSRACNVPDWERPCGRKASGGCVVSERASERDRGSMNRLSGNLKIRRPSSAVFGVRQASGVFREWKFVCGEELPIIVWMSRYPISAIFIVIPEHCFHSFNECSENWRR